MVDLDEGRLERRGGSVGLSEGKEREKRVARLMKAIGREGEEVWRGMGTPEEVREAFPGGRFKPFSEVSVFVALPSERPRTD